MEALSLTVASIVPVSDQGEGPYHSCTAILIYFVYSKYRIYLAMLLIKRLVSMAQPFGPRVADRDLMIVLLVMFSYQTWRHR